MNYSLYVRIRRIVYRLVLKKCLIKIGHEYFIGRSIIQSFIRFNGITEVNKAHQFYLSMMRITNHDLLMPHLCLQISIGEVRWLTRLS